MKHEFNVKKYKDATVYTLESASGGATGAGAVASVSMPIGGVRKRGANLIAQEEQKEAPKPRNFVAKNAKMGGAGQHKDKKKAAKQGDVKHKNREMDMAEAGSPAQQAAIAINMKKHHQKPKGVAEGDSGAKYKVKSIGHDSKGDYYISPSTGKKVYKQANKGDHENPKTGEIKKKIAEDHEIQMASSELQSIAKNAVHLLDLVRKYSEQEGLEAWQQSKITKAADYLNAVLQSVSGEQTPLEGYGSNRGYQQGFASPTAPSLGQRHRDHDSGDDEPQGMFTVVIDGRPWKEFTSNKAFQVAKTISAKYPDKQVQVKWPTGQLNTVKEDEYMKELANKVAEKLDPNAPVDDWVQDFQNANPEKYHQFRQNNRPGTKKPAEKIAQMAAAASYAAKTYK